MNIPSDSHYIKLSFETCINVCLYALILNLVNFQLRDSMFVNIAFHLLVTSHWSDRSVSFSTSLAALFILITQTDLVYHQQFGLVYSRSLCLGDKLSSLVREDVWDTFWRWPPEQTLHVMVWVVTELILICFPSTILWGDSVYKSLKELIWAVSTYPCWKIYELFLH